MNLLISTPCFGRMLHQSYVSSLVGMIEGLTLSKTEFQTLFQGNESFIQRARNEAAHYALTSSTNFTHLLFIDADTGWEWLDFTSLIQANRDIISGMCPYKKYPIEYVFNPLPEAKQDKHGVIEVKHAPTGFMLIRLDVLRRHTQSVPTYRGKSSVTGRIEYVWNFFRAGIAKDGQFETEDWGFASQMRELGEKVFMHTRVHTTHTGNHTFRTEKS